MRFSVPNESGGAGTSYRPSALSSGQVGLRVFCFEHRVRGQRNVHRYGIGEAREVAGTERSAGWDLEVAAVAFSVAMVLRAAGAVD